MLNTYQLAARKRSEKKTRIARLCHLLDSYVTRGEALKSGKTRMGYLVRAEQIRAELREIDH